MTINGNGFEKDGAKGVNVYFGDRNARVIKVDGDDKIVVEAPQGEPGSTIDVTVRFDDARENVLPKSYSYHAAPGEKSAPAKTEETH